MAGTPRPQPPWGAAETPTRRVGSAGAPDVVVLILPFLVLAAAAGVLVGRVVALPLLAVGLLIRPAVLVATGTTPGLRRQHIRVVRTGNRPAAWWQVFAWNVAPFLIAVPALFSGDLPLAMLGWVLYLVALGLGWWRGRGRGPNSDPFLPLVGLDGAWVGEPPTPSGTSGPPAPGPPPPTPPAPTTPAPAPRPETPGLP